MKNHAALIAFWKSNTTRKNEGKYLQKLFARGNPEGASRAQTTEIRVFFDDREVRVRVTMANGASQTFTCRGAFRSNKAASFGKELGVIAYGNSDSANRIATLLRDRKSKQELVITRGGVSLEDAPVDETEHIDE